MQEEPERVADTHDSIAHDTTGALVTQAADTIQVTLLTYKASLDFRLLQGLRGDDNVVSPANNFYSPFNCRKMHILGS